MSTQIKDIKGTWHERTSNAFEVTHGEAEISINRFNNGAKRGTAIQLTVSQHGVHGEASYIHLNRKQVSQLVKVLTDCFDYNKYPSE